MLRIKWMYIVVIFNTLVHNQSFGQVPVETVASFQRMYNNDHYDSIYGSFSPEMKTVLPLQQTRNFFSLLFSGAGRILNMEFNRVENGFSVYKTKFERNLYAVNLSIDQKRKINGLLVQPYTEKTSTALKRNKTSLSLPFKEEWTVFWGGDTKDQNYHVDNPAQKNAFDLVITDENGRSFKTDGRRNEDYYAFGRPILAPCDGEIVMVVDGVWDNVPGKLNDYFITGNTVILKTGNNEFLLFAHFRQHSIKVKQGQKVKKGDILGSCGNSGNSSEPHLHFHMQDKEDINEAKGIKMYFENIVVSGVKKSNHSPVKREKIRNQ